MKQKYQKKPELEVTQLKNTANLPLYISSVPIAYVVEKFPSPTEYFILNEIIELEKKGFEITILVLRKQKKYVDILKLNQLKSSIIYLPNFYFVFPFLSFLLSPVSFFRFILSDIHSLNTKFLKQMRDLGISLFFYHKLKNKKIRHFHAHFAFLAVDIASKLSKIQKKKYSLTVHAQDIYVNIPKIKQVVNDALFTITCTKFNSNYLNKITNSKYKTKIFIVYHGIDISKWSLKTFTKELYKSDYHILSVARLVEKKGLIYLLKAIQILIDQGVKVKCTIIGEGPLKKQLDRYIQDNYLHHFIQILDFMHQEDLKEHYAISDIFILPSIVSKDGDRDGLPNVILEAMSMEIPVISTPVSAITEIIQDRITGLLVERSNEHAIVDAVLELKNNPALYNKIVKNSKRKLLDEFIIENSTNKLIACFKNNVQNNS